MTLDTSRQYTDKELRSAQFLCAKPEAQDNLIGTLPEGADLVRLENLYAVSAATPKVRCAGCGSRLHRHGFTGLLSTGQRVLLGSTCGAKAFGSWEIAKRELDGLRGRQYYLAAIDRLTENADAIEREFDLWLGCATALDATVAQFRAGMPDLFNALWGSARRGGQLTSLKRVQVRTIRQDGSMRLTTRDDVVGHGAVPGKAVFEVERAHWTTQTARAAIRDLLRAGDNPNGITAEAELQARKARAEATVRSLEELHTAFEGLPALFAPASLSMIVDWSKKVGHLKGAYRKTPTGLVRDDGAASVSLSTGYAPPSHELLDLLQDMTGRNVNRRAA